MKGIRRIMEGVRMTLAAAAAAAAMVMVWWCQRCLNPLYVDAPQSITHRTTVVAVEALLTL
jgi:hypothetical protein